MRWERRENTVDFLFRKYKSLELIPRPFFQRNLVWAEQGKSNFIESILLNFPIAAIYLNQIDSKWEVIDGQQRLTTIFDFIEDKFKLTNLNKFEELNGYTFSGLSPKNQRIILEYYISTTIVTEASKSDVIDMYSRINKYTVNLNEQELRKAAYYNSDFLELSEELAINDFFNNNNFFTPRKRQRMADIEYVSELLCIIFEGMQDKKKTLDSFYDKFSHIDNKDNVKSRFLNVLEIISNIFPETLNKTRYNQQADFYSFFALIYDQYFKNKYSFQNTSNEKIKEFLLFYDQFITPASPIQTFSTYAIKCVSQSNTKSSRQFRYDFLLETLNFIENGAPNRLIDKLLADINDTFDKDYQVEIFNNLNTLTTLINENLAEYDGE